MSIRESEPREARTRVNPMNDPTRHARMRHPEGRPAGWALAAVLSLAVGSSARAESTTVDSRLDAAVIAINGALERSLMPGVVVGITDRTRTRKVVAHGYADLKTKAPLTPDSLFAIGSISKSFTAVALMELHDAGRFDPQASIQHYLPWFTVKSRYPAITGHQLLSHTAGLPLYRADMSSSRYAAYVQRELEPAYAPGSHYWYSDLGFQILGYALETIANAPYQTFVRQNVLDKLGMTSSFAVVDDSMRSALPVSYVEWPYDGKEVESPWFEYAAADGSIASTAADMCAYARFILNRGVGDHGRVLSEESFELLTTPVLEGYAYGLRVRKADGDTLIGHSGGIAGFESRLEAHMNDGFAVVLLSNGGLDAGKEKWIIDAVQAAYRGTPLPTPTAPIPPTPGAEEYAGAYRASGGGTLNFIRRESQLLLQHGDTTTTLIRMGTDSFRTPTDARDEFPFIFGRASSDAGSPVVGVSRGAEWLVNDRYIGGTAPAAPDDYLAYVGHYENHNPEGPRVRVFVRGSRLMALMEGEVPTTGIEALDRVGDATFRPAKPSYNPERLRFDTVVDGHALRLFVSGAPLYRVDTP
jgi:D-alanyl-D-alanine carboxypeptidase